MIVIFDVAIVGAGVVGALTARELSRYKLSVALLEKHSDMAMEATHANSGIVHAGFDAKTGTLKAKLNVLGVKRMRSLCSLLAVPLENIGSLVVAFSSEERATLDELYERGVANGVPDMEIIEGDALFELEPNISREAVAALLAPTASIVCPFELAIAAAENAVLNGTEYYRDFEVTGIESGENFTLVSSDGRKVNAKYVINAAGVFSDKLAGMIGDESFKITARKGEYMLLDRNCAGLARHVIFQCPSAMGKGALVAPTVDNNTILGPTAADTPDRFDNATTAEGLAAVRALTLKSIPSIPFRSVITSFTGVRAVGDTGDFIISPSAVNERFINVAGIESPGLSAAPAIAEYVRDILFSLGVNAAEKPDFIPGREPPVRFRELDDDARRELIKKSSAYGRIICRCETVTEGEIIDAIRAPAGARDIDAVKRRTRAGMGRCQGGFCASKVQEILARELGKNLDEITKFGGGSKILYGRTK